MTTIPPPSFEDLMRRYHGEIERMVSAAEVHCPVHDRENCCVIGQSNEKSKCNGCPFQDFFKKDGLEKDPNLFECRLLFLRRWIGDHIPPGEPVQEIGQCVHGTRKNDVIICGETFGACEHQEFFSSVPLILHCRREAAALAACEQYQQEDRR